MARLAMSILAILTLAASAPTMAARGEESDRLIACFTLKGRKETVMSSAVRASTSLFEMLTAAGERLLSAVVPSVQAGACIPDNGAICLCSFSPDNSCYYQSPPKKLVGILNCNGDCVVLGCGNC
jgi:hypothetical protein